MAAIAKVTDLSASDVAAILSLGPNPGSTVSDLAKILGLTHSAAVRLADRLERRDLLTREAQAGRREVALRLTDTGRRQRSQIAKVRAETLEDCLGTLPEIELIAFEHSVQTLLTHLTVSRAQADRLCRLCDESVCPKERCPVECRAIELECNA